MCVCVFFFNTLFVLFICDNKFFKTIGTFNYIYFSFKYQINIYFIKFYIWKIGGANDTYRGKTSTFQLPVKNIQRNPHSPKNSNFDVIKKDKLLL